jgi:hypothetical protein
VADFAIEGRRTLWKSSVVDPSLPDDDRPPPDDGSTNNRSMNNRSTNNRGPACGNAAGPDHAACTDDGACFHGAPGGEAQQQQRHTCVLHGFFLQRLGIVTYSSPSLFWRVGLGVSTERALRVPLWASFRTLDRYRRGALLNVGKIWVCLDVESAILWSKGI